MCVGVDHSTSLRGTNWGQASLQGTNIEPLYKLGTWSLSTRDKLGGGGSFVPGREVFHFSEVTNLYHYAYMGSGLVLCSEVVLFSECPLSEVLLYSLRISLCVCMLSCITADQPVYPNTAPLSTFSATATSTSTSARSALHNPGEVYILLS